MNMQLRVLLRFVLLALGVAVTLGLGGAIQPLAPSPFHTNPARGSAQEEGYKLAVFYVIPSDIPFDQKVFDRLVTSTLEMQAWYQVASGGVTWELAFPEVVHVYQAQEGWEFYKNTNNWWGSLVPEMQAAGLPIWSPGTVTAIWAQGAGGWAGAAQGCSGDCGVALLAVELFPEFNNLIYSGRACPDPDGQGIEAWPCVPDGAFSHELGHTLGLIHPLDNPVTASVASHSIMQSHWNFPDQAPAFELPWGFLSTERQQLQTQRFMKRNIELAQRYQDLDVTVNLPQNGVVPKADFNLVVIGDHISATNKTKGAALSYWTFGDSSASNQTNPTHVYAANGTYTVTLRASTSQGMMGVARHTVVIAASPSPTLTQIPTAMATPSATATVTVPATITPPSTPTTVAPAPPKMMYLPLILR